MYRWDAVFFDWDGTLADTHPLYWDATLAVGERHGLAFPDGTRADPRYQSMAPLEFFAHHFTASGVNDAEAGVLAARATHAVLELFLSEMVPRILLFPYALEILADARGHVGTVGLVTSSPRAVMDATLARLSLGRYFDLVITADDVERRKPHPEPYLAAKRRMRAKRVIVVENTPVGIASGKDAMATVVGIASSHAREELCGAGAHYAAEDHETLKWLLVTLYLAGRSGRSGA